MGHKKSKLKKSKRIFTLLEMMVAIVLLAIGAGAIAINMQSALAKKRFTSQVGRFQSRVELVHKLAVAMQVDWKGTLKKNGKEWVFETVCEEGAFKQFPPLRLCSIEIVFDRRQINELELDFYGSGQILPAGTFLFTSGSENMEWKL